jgi:hypothetical protein
MENPFKVAIQESVVDWQIIVTELGPPTGRGPIKFMRDVKFKKLAELREYFHEQYAVAVSLGYKPKVQPHPDKYGTMLTGRLAMSFRDRFAEYTYELVNVNDFVEFLKANPMLAQKVGLS